VSSLARFLDDEREAYVLGVLRVAVGALVVVQTAQRLLELRRGGYFGDVFHLPLLPEALVPALPVYLALQLVALCGGVLAVLGWCARGGLFLSAGIGLFLLFANRLDYHNNRFALLLLALLAAFTPCDRSLLLVRSRARALPEAERRGPVFATNLIRLTVSAVYLSSGGGKLLDADWRGGQTMLVRFARSLEDLTARGVTLPEPLASAVASPLLASLASKAAISLELFLAVALWLPKLRPLALYAGVLFHLNIELSARVELFSYVMGVAYVAFVVPEVRERVVELDPGSTWGRWLGGALPWVDWLARFRVVVTPGAPFAVVDRSGDRHTGVAAFGALARAIPAVFPLYLPLAGLGKMLK
jgi:hypothetical protein